MLIGLTGGIGSGKSTVSEFLVEQGAVIVDADAISRLVVAPGSPAMQEIKDSFGSEMILPDGNLDRKRMGRLVFANKAELDKLSSIMNRRIAEEIKRQIEVAESELVVLDAATLIEAGYDKIVDVLWIVDADDEVRIKRVMARDGATREEVIDRMNNQLSRKERLNRKCEVIDNSGSIEEMQANVRAALKKIRSR